MKEKNGAILVLGSLNVDVVTRVAHIPGPGETLLCQDYRFVPGGKGANQAAAIARLGGRVWLAGSVGRDFFGEFLKENLRQAGVDTRLVQEEKTATTGLALIMVDRQGENSIVVVGGANRKVGPHRVEGLLPYLRKASFLLLQLEIPLETVFQALLFARRLSLPVILDPGPARDLPQSIFPLISFILPNESETEKLLRVKITGIKSARQAARRLVQLGVKCAVVKLGAKGCVLASQGQTVHLPALSVKAVDTTAAGDVFAGAFALALAEGRESLSATKFATVADGLSVTRAGAQTSIPTRREVEALIRRKKIKL
ncbi:MAG TPA: ribokinase [bacterium]|nr:ribokinase [bacterium]